MTNGNYEWGWGRPWESFKRWLPSFGGDWRSQLPAGKAGFEPYWGMQAKKPTAKPFAYTPTTVPPPFDVYETPPVSVAEKGIDIIPGLKWMMTGDEKNPYKYYTQDARGNWIEVPQTIAEMMIDDYRTKQAGAAKGQWTEAERATFEWNKQQAEYQRQREQQQAGREIDAAERERARLQLAAQQPAMTWQERQNIAAQERENLMKQLEGSPMDWIPYWTSKYGEGSAYYNQMQAQRGAEAAANAVSVGGIGPFGFRYGAPESPYFAEKGLPYSSALFGEYGGRMVGAGGAITPEPPKTPPAPGWLPQFAPSQKTGQAITKGEVITPSGQQWGRTPWDIQQALQGYTKWAGQDYQTLLEQMQMMLPETPRGVGSKTWMPARRR